MSNTTIVNYTDLQSKISELKIRLEDKVTDMNTKYSAINSSISTMDGATNASLQEALEKNRQKAYVTSEILSNLLVFFEDAAAFVHEQDLISRGNYDNNYRPNARW